ncbi:hypothetical protein PCL_09315 [Purpureocillium lilacinum]|uniref:Uncharacterized protein n=1 Tax=Purpureocillium lilacinum TaxID=33203 RepID=A0A2U3EHP4_PURLI|nr:hypothetical protein PCL_09315 [Purpureocillium lilacinum]
MAVDPSAGGRFTELCVRRQHTHLVNRRRRRRRRHSPPAGVCMGQLKQAESCKFAEEKPRDGGQATTKDEEAQRAVGLEEGRGKADQGMRCFCVLLQQQRREESSDSPCLQYIFTSGSYPEGQSKAKPRQGMAVDPSAGGRFTELCVRRQHTPLVNRRRRRRRRRSPPAGVCMGPMFA